MGGASLSPAPFTGYGMETNDNSDSVWTFTFIRALINEVYRENTSSFCGQVGKDITNKPLVFPQTIEKSHSVEIMFFEINQCILFTILQISTSVRQESITATPMLSVTTLKALTIVHANQDLSETALTAQVK